MREDSDHFRHYVPLLRRIVIVVAVLAAIPVILWTITLFMRSYVGPPKLPNVPPAGGERDGSAAAKRERQPRQRHAAFAAV